MAIAGSASARAGARSVLQKAGMFLLAVILCLGLMPSSAWAARDDAASSDGAVALEEGASDASAAQEHEAADEAAGQEGADEPSGGSAEEAGEDDAAAPTTPAAAGEEGDAAPAKTAYGLQAASTSSDRSASAAPAAQAATADDASSAAPADAATISAKASIIGVNASGNADIWAPSRSYDLPEGSTAADLTIAMFKETGIKADYDPDGQYGFSLSTITSPDDPSFAPGWDAATGKYWQLFVNGKPSDVGAGSVILKPGDAVTWCYSAGGEELPAEQFSVSVSVMGPDADGATTAWANNGSVQVELGTSAADLIEQVLNEAGLAHEATGVGTADYYLSTITSVDGRQLGWDAATGKYWQVFVNGEPSDKGAGRVGLAAGDSIVLYYSAFGDALPGYVSASMEVTGVDANGTAQRWMSTTSIALEGGATAADLTEALFNQEGIKADIHRPDSAQNYWVLNAVTSPFDPNTSLAYDEATGAFWQLFINGKSASVGADDYVLQPGDVISWVYGSSGTMPGGDDIVIDPQAPRPDWSADWPGFANGGSGSAVTEAPTPDKASSKVWQVQMKDPSDWQTYVSDPIVVNGRLYVAVGDELRVLDAKTSERIGGAPLAAPISSVSRMVYADGLIVVPLEGGRLQALTADALTTVWLTDELAPIGDMGTQQSLSSLFVQDGRVYYGTAAASFGGESLSGYLLCVSLDDGSVIWQNANEQVGYYWSGAAFAGSWMVIGDDAGTVSAVDPATGKVVSAANLGAPVRANLVAGAEEGTVLAVSNDGVLHKIAVDPESGAVSEVASVKFASSSTSTPTLADGKVYVGGVARDGVSSRAGGGVLAVIDAASLSLEREVCSLDGGDAVPADVKSAPLVSKQGGDTYVYFTSNSTPGGIYSYHVGDASAMTVFVPDDDYQNYCMTSVVCGADGVLYYVNDSGALFAVAGAPSTTVTFAANNGTDLVVRYVAVGKPMAAPADPQREGYRFDGWFTDGACTKAWNFDDAVTGELVLYAKWTPLQQEQKPVQPQEQQSQKNPQHVQNVQNVYNVVNVMRGGGGLGGATQVIASDGTAEEAVVEAEEPQALASNDAGSASAAASGAAAPTSATAEPSAFPWLAVAGIALGVCGLAGAIVAAVWLARSSRKGGRL